MHVTPEVAAVIWGQLVITCPSGKYAWSGLDSRRRAHETSDCNTLALNGTVPRMLHLPGHRDKDREEENAPSGEGASASRVEGACCP